MSRQQLGGPVLLKQGYMQVKTMFGWKRHYYRLLQVRACFSSPSKASGLLTRAALCAALMALAFFRTRCSHSARMSPRHRHMRSLSWVVASRMPRGRSKEPTACSLKQKASRRSTWSAQTLRSISSGSTRCTTAQQYQL
jgi:hypothetical protein